MLLVLDGEGLHEDPARLTAFGYSGHTRLQPWDVGLDCSVFPEEHMGLALLRPVLPQLERTCREMGEPPVVGLTVAELLREGGL
eukprot:514234-Prymnesium_polylepis.1